MRLLHPFLLAALSILSGQSRDPLPVPDIPGYRTLKCDFHLHTVFSDGTVWPDIRVFEAWTDGLDAIAITDHSDYQPHKQDVQADLRRANEVAADVAAKLGMLLVPGVEITKGDLHFNALFVRDPNAFGEVDIPTALRRAADQGAFVFWNHPGWKHRSRWEPEVDAAYRARLIQGLEVVNGTAFYEDAYPWIAEKGLTILANSDMHRPAGLEYRERQRPVLLVFAKSASLEGIREALAARRTAAWVNGQVWGAEEWLTGLWQGAVKAENPEVRFTPRSRSAYVRVRNTSAIPFRLRVTGQPEWMEVECEEARQESVSLMTVSLKRGAPAGRHEVKLSFEIPNLHPAAGKGLAAGLTLAVTVEPQ